MCITKLRTSIVDCQLRTPLKWARLKWVHVFWFAMHGFYWTIFQAPLSPQKLNNSMDACTFCHFQSFADRQARRRHSYLSEKSIEYWQLLQLSLQFSGFRVKARHLMTSVDSRANTRMLPTVLPLQTRKRNCVNSRFIGSLVRISK